MKKVFRGPSREEAKQQADQWWAAQKGLRKLSEIELAAGDKGPSIRDTDRWSVIIRYERQNSN